MEVSALLEKPILALLLQMNVYDTKMVHHQKKCFCWLQVRGICDVNQILQRAFLAIRDGDDDDDAADDNDNKSTDDATYFRFDETKTNLSRVKKLNKYSCAELSQQLSELCSPMK